MIPVETMLQEAEQLLTFVGEWEHWNLRAQHMTSTEAKINYAISLVKEKLPTYDPARIRSTKQLIVERGAQ